MSTLAKLTKSDKNFITILLAGVILLSMFIIALFSAMGNSGIVDEIAHIPAGYSYDKYHDYRLNPEHPPIAKALAGVPLTFLKLNGLKADWSWDAINQWESGWYFLYEAGNNPKTILFWSRLPMLLLMLGLAVLLFTWAKKSWGRKAGLFALLLIAFYPDILGHGGLVTTDIAAAFGYLIAIFAFDKLLERRTFASLLWAAAAFALAQLLKFSAFLLFAIFLILVIARAFMDRTDEVRFWPKFWSYFKSYFWTCAISLVIVTIVYIPFVWNTPPAIEHQVIESNLTSNPSTLVFRNFLHHFENNPFTRALGHYLLGVMLVLKRVEGGNAVYILGNLSDKSISWFFPVAWLIKTPIPIIILVFWSIITAIVFRTKNKKDLWENWLLLTPIVVYWAFTLKGQLNIGIRHLMPTVPFMVLFIAKQMQRYLNKPFWTTQSIVIFGLSAWLIVDVLSYYPQYIAYFNNVVPRDKRYEYMTDSSLDWGQDLLRLKDYVDENNIDAIKVDYFGGSVPQYYIPQAEDWHSSYGPATGWLAVSATYYQSSKLYGPQEGKWSYDWLDNFTPTAEIGGSILVFHITPQDLNENPPESPYPITHTDLPGSLTIDRSNIIINNN
ncbi:MAG: glycosyltransferase family 39 protein [Patescibacteria group bacterium]